MSNNDNEKCIEIDETVIDQVPAEFLTLPNYHSYSLTKLSSSRPNWFVVPGMSTTGHVRIVNVLDKPGVLVYGTRTYDYIRTSPIVKVLDTTSHSLTFQTEGGEYRLEWPQRKDDTKEAA